MKPSLSMANHSTRTIRIGPGRTLTATTVFDTFLRFAVSRQEVFLKRVAGVPPPWTADAVLNSHRFTNVYRASDRVSQYLIRRVQYNGDQSIEEVFFRTLLFKFFNRIETWEALERALGSVTWHAYSFNRYARVLDGLLAIGSPVYSGAYIMPSPRFGEARKHRNHLRLLEFMMRSAAPSKFASARSLADAYGTLRTYQSLGPFLAFQFSIDLNYSTITEFSEMAYVVAGPGARDGIKKCFLDTSGLDDADVIRAVTETADDEFRLLGLRFPCLWGRPLHLIDCQNLFCEVSKYARVAHPDVIGCDRRTRIKQKYSPTSRSIHDQWYPPKWKLAPPVPNVRANIFSDD